MPANPTRIRYLIVLVAMLAAVLLYLERVCVSVADVYIREDLRIGKMEMDAAFGAFFIAYALAQVPSGWLSQRYGPRLMLTLYLIGWSVFGVFIALAQDFWTLFAARFLLGLSQAGAYPTAALLIKRWVPDRRRGLASGVVSFGGRAGGAAANVLTGFLIVAFVPISTPATLKPADILDPELFWTQRSEFYPSPQDFVTVKVAVLRELSGTDRGPGEIANAMNNVIRGSEILVEFEHAEEWGATLSRDGQRILQIPPRERTQQETERLNRLLIEKTFPGVIRQLHVDGWRPTLLLYGLLGVLVGGIFWVTARDWPRNHPWANAAEVALIEAGQSQSSQTAGTNAIPWRELIASRNQWLFSASNFFANIGWVFLITLMPRFLAERFAVPVEQRGLMTTIPLLVASFGLIAGGWCTDSLTRTLGPWLGRAIPMGAFKFPCAAVLAVSTLLPDPWTVTIALAVMSLCQDFGLPAVWAFAQDTGGKQAATVLGWGNMWGNFGAGLGPSLVGGIAVSWGWNAALYTGAFAFVACGIAGMMTNAAEPLFRSDEALS